MKSSTHLMIHRLIKSIADSIIKVFMPILIFQQTGDLTLCFVYFLASFALTSLFFFFGRKIVQKAPIIFIIVSIFLIISLNLMLLLKLNIWIILLISLIEALYSVLYYGSINMIFGLLDKNANTAKFESGEYIGKVIFTILSAYILGNIQNSLLFVILTSVFLYILCFIPLFIKFKEIQGKIKVLPKQSQKAIFKDIKKFNIYHVIYGLVNFSITYFLPFYFYVNGLSFSSTGYLIALQNICSLTTRFSSNFIEKKKLTKYFVFISALLMIPAFFVIIFVNNIVACYISSLVLTLASNFIYIVIYRRYVLDQTKKNYFHDSVFYRDVFMNLRRTISPAIFLMAPFYPVIFGISIASSVAIMFSSRSCLKQTNHLIYAPPQPSEDNFSEDK